MTKIKKKKNQTKFHIFTWWARFCSASWFLSCDICSVSSVASLCSSALTDFSTIFISRLLSSSSVECSTFSKDIWSCSASTAFSCCSAFICCQIGKETIWAVFRANCILYVRVKRAAVSMCHHLEKQRDFHNVDVGVGVCRCTCRPVQKSLF